jgi:hypothetical protein
VQRVVQKEKQEKAALQQAVLDLQSQHRVELERYKAMMFGHMFGHAAASSAQTSVFTRAHEEQKAMLQDQNSVNSEAQTSMQASHEKKVEAMEAEVEALKTQLVEGEPLQSQTSKELSVAKQSLAEAQAGLNNCKTTAKQERAQLMQAQEKMQDELLAVRETHQKSLDSVRSNSDESVKQLLATQEQEITQQLVAEKAEVEQNFQELQEWVAKLDDQIYAYKRREDELLTMQKAQQEEHEAKLSETEVWWEEVCQTTKDENTRHSEATASAHEAAIAEKQNQHAQFLQTALAEKDASHEHAMVSHTEQHESALAAALTEKDASHEHAM